MSYREHRERERRGGDPEDRHVRKDSNNRRDPEYRNGRREKDTDSRRDASNRHIKKERDWDDRRDASDRHIKKERDWDNRRDAGDRNIKREKDWDNREDAGVRNIKKEKDWDDRRDFSDRNIKREKDWDDFFNPESDMSRKANVKRKVHENEREQRLQEHRGGPSSGDGEEQMEKQKPNFGLSGKLAEETNMYKGIVIKYSEPPEARKPLKTRWRLYPFKDGESLEVMYIHRQSAYLLGRERKIADIPIDHPSCSKQHAVIQYRLVPYEKPNGTKGRRIRPYVIDLESANGTFVNGEKIAPKRYVELMEKDVLKFGFSSREYVLLHDQSKDDEPLDDDGYRSPSPE